MITRKKLILNWSEKADVYDYKNHSLAGERGIYMITRIWGINSEKEYPEKLLMLLNSWMKGVYSVCSLKHLLRMVS